VILVTVDSDGDAAAETAWRGSKASAEGQEGRTRAVERRLFGADAKHSETSSGPAHQERRQGQALRGEPRSILEDVYMTHRRQRLRGKRTRGRLKAMNLLRQSGFQEGVRLGGALLSGRSSGGRLPLMLSVALFCALASGRRVQSLVGRRRQAHLHDILRRRIWP
jgi:hypothetical protein